MRTIHICLFLICLVMLFGIASAQPPVAAFTGMPRVGQAPLTVTFTDQSTGTPNGWAWYFGDENFTSPWTEQTPSAEWTARYAQSSVVMPDGSIVLTGGSLSPSGPFKNDVWRSTDNGTSWTMVNASAGWSARYGHNSVVMPDGSIVLIAGGSGPSYNDIWRSTNNGTSWTLANASALSTGRTSPASVVMPDGSIVTTGGWDTIGHHNNDTWRSTDNGTSWVMVNASAGWTARSCHSSVVMPDGSIILMGGYDGNTYRNDVWRSTNNGNTWTQVTASAEWPARYCQNSVVMPDGSIVVMGGGILTGAFVNDVWRSTNNGTTWTMINASAGWTGRMNQNSVVMPDGSVVITGGWDGITTQNDTWRLMTAGSLLQNPSHTFTTPGLYKVVLQVTNTVGSNSTWKTGYITVTNSTTKIGVTNGQQWYLDWNGNGAWDGLDRAYIFGAPGWGSVVGDWNATGKSYIGVTNGQQWYLDWNGNGAFDGADKAYSFGAPGWMNVTGDWNNDGKTDIGITNGQQWYMDWNNNGGWDAGIDRAYNFGAPGWTPVVGDWNATGKSYIGVTNGQQWYLDWNGDGAWDGTDRYYYFGAPGWKPVIGDWNGDGRTKVGVTNGQQWYLDTNGNGLWDILGIDYAYSFGAPGWTPVVGKWG